MKHQAQIAQASSRGTCGPVSRMFSGSRRNGWGYYQLTSLPEFIMESRITRASSRNGFIFVYWPDFWCDRHSKMNRQVWPNTERKSTPPGLPDSGLLPKTPYE